MLKDLIFKINNAWRSILIAETEKNYFDDLDKWVTESYKNNICFPDPKDIFKIFSIINPFEIKVIILGQDPYHSPNFADGIAFSCSKSNKFPLSLQNIYKEISKDFNSTLLKNNNLTYLVEQGVFLTNTILTVEKGKPGSHAQKGWETFIKNIFKNILIFNNNICIMLWGKNAEKYEYLFFGNPKLLVLKTTHPSPFSYNKGFKNCQHFKKCNKFLISKDINEINWGEKS